MGLKTIIYFVLRIVLGGFMMYGGIQKFNRPIPAPIEVVDKASSFSSPEQESTLQKVLYISGAKQTGYFWEVLGVCELLFGLLVLLQYPSFVGAVFLLPITLHIFLFHVFLEPEEVTELVQTGGLLAANMALVLKERARWKHLLWIRPT